jgi:hypothetical protein
VLPPVAVVAVAAPVLPGLLPATGVVSAVLEPHADSNILALTVSVTTKSGNRDLFIDSLLW